MQNNDKKYFIPVDGTPIEVSEEIYRAILPAHLEHPLPCPEERRVPLHQGPALEV